MTAPQSRIQPVVPVVVQQILGNKHQEFRLNGAPVRIAVIVGIVRNIKVESSEISFFIEDHTGKIKASMWLETDYKATSHLSFVQDNHHVKVFGSVRIQNDEKVFLIVKIFPVNDLTVITSHVLQAACTKMESEMAFKKQLVSASTAGAALANALAVTDEASSSMNPQLTPLQEAVINIVKSEHDFYGISKKNILQQFPAYQTGEVDETLNYLISVGIIYPTMDENHFKAINFST